MRSKRTVRLLVLLAPFVFAACGGMGELELDGSRDGSDADVATDAFVTRDGSDAALDATADVERDAALLDVASEGASDAHADTSPPADVTCRSPDVNCGGACVNTQSDEHNCGRCGHACLAGEVCLRGECSLNATCSPVHYPSVTIQAVPNASMTSLYAGIASGSCYPTPQCFLDLDHLEDPETGRSLDVHVMVSTHFELYEYVATEIAAGYTHFALVSPTLVQKMEALRTAEGGNPLGIASGFRSPQHQMAVCRSICPGGASCCPTASHPCGCRSEHEWGRAADLSISSSEYSSYATYSQDAHMPDCLLEAGSFHVDVSPCPIGCPYNF